MRWFSRVVIGLVVLYGFLTGYAIVKAVSKAKSMPQRNFAAPREWTYAAAIRGETFHVKGCPYLPKQEPHAANLIYFPTREEAARQNKTPCTHCIKDTTASVPSTPATTPSKNITQEK